MYFRRPPARSAPKISTMPRQQSESAHYLDIYKLTVEKKRLQQELTELDQRRLHLQQRLATLETQVTQLAQSAETLRQPTMPAAPRSVVYPPNAKVKGSNATFEMLTLEY
ncbi:hypothetical protein [Leptolyngbya sp. PCC 6406]|uniref:hypothetical protein n=1 Tax=Leptolyngbya sp. PCC 6406 TaxID=1173264 RepID=UPI0002ACA044|nr:hypothetical protein [Leptolyngbya sp. PCC 6406]